MARKKSKRPNLPQETLERARAELRGDAPSSLPVPPEIGSPVAATAAKVSAPANKRRAAGVMTPRRVPNIEELIGEYAYVLHDLRNLAILAGILLAAIVLMSFVLARPIG